MDREIALYTLEGVPDADTSTHPFTTDDKLGLSMLRFLRRSSDDVVLIIHDHHFRHEPLSSPDADP